MSKILKKMTIILFSLFSIMSVIVYGALFDGNEETYLVHADDTSIEFTLDTQLEEYLIELNGGEDLTADCFDSTIELVFDGTQSTACDGITEILGLSQFSFSSLTTVTIRNMTNLVSVDLQGNNNVVFPNLNNIVIENCTALTDLDFSGNNLSSISVSGSSCLNFELDSATAQSLTNLSLSDIAGDAFVIDYTMPSLTQATFEDNSALTEIKITGSNLKTLTISGNTYLINLSISSSVLNSLTLQGNSALQILDLTKATSLQTLQLDEMDIEENGYVVTHTLLYAPNLKKLFLTYNDWIEQFDISQSNAIETIVVSDCTSLKSLLLADDLQYLHTLDASNCYNLNELDFASAVNLQSLSLLECALINVDSFSGLIQMKGLEYLNLQGTNVRNITLQDCNNLQILLLGSSYLSSVYIDNLPSTFQFSIASSNNLKQIYVNDVPCLSSFNLDACGAIESINISDVALTSFSIAGKTQLLSLNLKSENLVELYVYDCENLNSIDFSQCLNLETVELLGCTSVGSTVVDNLTNLDSLAHLYVSECGSIYSFSLSNKIYLNYLNLSNLNNLTLLSLSNIGTSAKISLPTNMTTVRSLTLSGLSLADFGTTELDLSNGVLSAVTLEYLPFTSINLNNNAITSLTISNIYNLLYINVANNKITNVDAIMALLEASPQLSEVNLNNNRLDFSTGSALATIQGSIYSRRVIIGLQNIIEDNAYTYEPKIYFGGFGSFYANIDVIVYHSVDNYSKANLTDLVLREFSRSTLSTNKFTQFSNGTYYITYQKVDNNGNTVEMTDEEKAVFLPIYFTVTTEFDFIQFIWIIFLVVAGLILIYVGISWVIEKRRKARLIEQADAANEEYSGMSRKEIAAATREHKKLLKESEKIEKQKRKSQALIENSRRIEQKRIEKEQRAQKAQDDKLAKIAMREHKIEEKERKKAEREQEKLDKEREKFLTEKKKEKKQPESKPVNNKIKSDNILRQSENQKQATKTNGSVSKDINGDKISTKVDKSQLKVEKEEQKKRKQEEKEIAKLEKERQKLIKEREEENMFKDKAQERELKREQKELRKMERQNIKEEKKREKAEERALFSGETEIKPKKQSKKWLLKSVDDDDKSNLDIDLLQDKNSAIDDLGSVSDKDLEEIIDSSAKSTESKGSKQLPKLPKLK